MLVLARRACRDVPAEATTQRLCFMVENDMMPVNMMNEEVLNYTEPGYRIPSKVQLLAVLRRPKERRASAQFSQKGGYNDCRAALSAQLHHTDNTHNESIIDC